MSTTAPFTFNASQFELVPPARYYAFSYRLLGTIAASLVLAVGLTGNILVITVIMWTSKMRSPTNCYLVSLSFSDLLFLLHATAPLVYELYVMINQWTFGDAACRIMIAMQYLSVDASVLSMAAFSVERWVAICHPMRAQTLCTVNRALKIIAGIWIFSAAYNSVWLFTVTTEIRHYVQGTYTICTYKYARGRYLIVYLLDLILFYAIPLCLIFAMYMQITSRLFTFHKPLWLNPNKRKLNGERKTVKNFERRGNFISRSNISEQAGHGAMSRTGCRQVRSRKQVVKMLMTVVFLFAIFWLPYRSLVVYNSFVTIRKPDYWLYLFARTMAFLNSTVNPILYNAMSRKFRRAFRLLITQAPCIGKQRRLNSVLGSRRTECMRSRDYLRQIQLRRQELSGNVINETQNFEMRLIEGQDKHGSPKKDDS
ncbi:unnamed protein product [Hymenolepis diminuta]|uniref:Thyrotropin-releasing hormone receptor n=2 Tax=Hymenolepis diminuta TaxID=6216 RepID=A0A158QCR8_HYMDI|nr:unnamed protein product [Hymenolepis diminuta]